MIETEFRTTGTSDRDLLISVDVSVSPLPVQSVDTELWEHFPLSLKLSFDERFPLDKSPVSLPPGKLLDTELLADLLLDTNISLEPLLDKSADSMAIMFSLQTKLDLRFSFDGELFEDFSKLFLDESL